MCNLKFAAISALFLILGILIPVESFRSFKTQSRELNAASLDMIDQRMNSLFYEINNFPRYAGDDILFLARLPDAKQGNITAFENDLLAFIKENIAYQKLIYIGKDGETLASVEYDGQKYQRSERKTRQTSASADWFTKTLSLNEGEVYVSHLGVDQDNQKSVPIIKYGTPIYAADESLQGIIIAFVDATYFLEDIRRSQRNAEEVFLIDNSGTYLAHPKKEKEFGEGKLNGSSFTYDYPDAFNKIQKNPDKQLFEIDGRIFAFRYMYPTTTSFALYKGAEKIGNGVQDNYFWVMVSVVDKNSIEKPASELLKQNTIFLTFFAFILVTAYILFLRLTFYDKKINPE